MNFVEHPPRMVTVITFQERGAMHQSYQYSGYSSHEQIAQDLSLMVQKVSETKSSPPTFSDVQKPEKKYASKEERIEGIKKEMDTLLSELSFLKNGIPNEGTSS